MITPSTNYSLVPYLGKKQDIIVRPPRIVSNCRANCPNTIEKEHLYKRINRYEPFMETFYQGGMYNEKSHVSMPETSMLGLLINIYA